MLAQQVSRWEVLEGKESLSDHLYIAIHLRITGSSSTRHPTRTMRLNNKGFKNLPPCGKWAVKKMNIDLLIAAACVAAWPAVQSASLGNLEKEEDKLTRVLKNICNTAMPKSKPHPRRGNFWWSRDIECSRSDCIRTRRRFQRAHRKKHRDLAAEEALYREYREAVIKLQGLIKEAKSRAWNEFCQTLEQDPWGRPYRIVLGKLKSYAQPITESLDPTTLNEILSTLFPDSGEVTEQTRAHTGPPFPPVGAVSAIAKMSKKITAPGPDGIPSRALVLALPEISPTVRSFFDKCLQVKYFPKKWKTAKPVLIRKPGKKDPHCPSSYRPICLLDEMGKLFERIISSRINSHLPQSGHDLANDQYGFRTGRSTIDAINNVLEYSRSALSQGGLALAVSLDIVNAFNSLPWSRIIRALPRHGLPHTSGE